MPIDFGKLVKGAAKILVKNGLPALASAVPGGPLILGGILSAVGIETEGRSEADVLSDLDNLTPEQLTILKDHETKQRQQDLENVISARKDTKDIKFLSPHFVLASIVVVLFAVVIAGIIFVLKDVSGAEEKFIFYALGVLSAETTRVLNFFFGSSLGSKRKTDIMANGHG